MTAHCLTHAHPAKAVPRSDQTQGESKRSKMIAAADDPILSARAGAYAASYRRRSGEAPPTPAVRYPSGSEGAGR